MSAPDVPFTISLSALPLPRSTTSWIRPDPLRLFTVMVSAPAPASRMTFSMLSTVRVVPFPVKVSADPL